MTQTAKKQNIKIIKPQPGFQEKFMSTSADIAIGGGCAAAGKSWAAVIEPLKRIQDPNFGAVIFRGDKARIRAMGAIFDESKKWYGAFGGTVSETIMRWTFPSGAKIDFNGIEHEKDLEKWQGSQIPLIVFDELTEFERSMFFFMISRNRGSCNGKRPYIRATCNPKPDSWLASFIAWWIDQETGYPIPERAGVLRYYTSSGDLDIWGDSYEDVIKKAEHIFRDEKFIASGINPKSLIKSVTFIPGDIYENKILLSENPGYLASLSSMNEADQNRFLRGNWKRTVDDLGIFEEDGIKSMFTEVVENVAYDETWNNNYITCDAAKFGADLCVIYVWVGFTVIHISVMHLSDTFDIVDELEYLRNKHRVLKYNVCVDQDGVGGDVMKLGKGYRGFHAREKTYKDPDTREKENYKYVKDQCFYRMAARVNQGKIKMIISVGTVRIKDKGASRFRNSFKIVVKGVAKDIRTVIAEHLRAIKKGESTLEDAGVLKISINDKEEQRKFLDGRSPDFADTLMMREIFELKKIKFTGIHVDNG